MFYGYKLVARFFYFVVALVEKRDTVYPTLLINMHLKKYVVIADHS